MRAAAADGSFSGIELVHQVAEHRALAAAGGDDAARGARLDALRRAGARLDRSGFDVPVDRDRIDIVERCDQALVAQVAQCQQLGGSAQRHQRDHLALVDEQRQWPLGRDVDRSALVRTRHAPRPRASAALGLRSGTAAAASGRLAGGRRHGVVIPARRQPFLAGALAPAAAGAGRGCAGGSRRRIDERAGIGAGRRRRCGLDVLAGLLGIGQVARRPRDPSTGTTGSRRPCCRARSSRRPRRPWPWLRRTAPARAAWPARRRQARTRMLRVTMRFMRSPLRFSGRPAAGRPCATAAPGSCRP